MFVESDRNFAAESSGFRSLSQLHQDELAAIMPILQDQMWFSHGRSLFKHLQSLRCPMPDV